MIWKQKYVCMLALSVVWAIDARIAILLTMFKFSSMIVLFLLYISFTHMCVAMRSVV